MVKYNKTNITAKNGINYVRSVVEESGSLFHKIELENDLGIDALIELVRDEKPLSKQIAVQIKAGSSYFNKAEKKCTIPIGKHYNYWLNYPLEVYGIVYIPSLKCAHWVDIKKEIEQNKNESIIKFEISELNKFNNSSFIKFFMPKILCEIPTLPLKEAIKYFTSRKHEEFFLGLLVLFRKFINSKETWDYIVDYFIKKPIEEIPNIMIYYLAHIPWHSDIAYSGEAIKTETRAYAKILFQQFGQEEVSKLLKFIDDENGISRGSYGESVEAIISSLPSSNNLLSEIIQNEDEELTVRQFAAFIFAMNNGEKAIPIISNLVNSGSSFTQKIIDHIIKYGALTPYM